MSDSPLMVVYSAKKKPDEDFNIIHQLVLDHQCRERRALPEGTDALA